METVFHDSLKTTLMRAAVSCLPAFATRFFGPSFWHSAKCLFVLSTGRSGTDTLSRLLGQAPGIRALHEPEPQLLCDLKRIYAEAWSKPAEYRQIFSNARANAIIRAHLRQKIYAETSYRLTFFAPAIADLLPNATFIHLYRHPADVVRSGMRRGWYAKMNNLWDLNRLVPPEADPAWKCWNEWSPFAKICWYWDAHNRFALRFRETVGRNRVLAIRSEDLFSPGLETASKLFSFLDVCCPPQNLIQEVLVAKHNAQKTGDYPRPGEWDSATRQVLEQISGETMRELGYKWDC